MEDDGDGLEWKTLWQWGRAALGRPLYNDCQVEKAE